MNKNETIVKRNLPYGSMITLLSLWCAFISILLSMTGKFTEAAVLIIISGIFDVLDGKVARLTGTSSKFGAELDSLADMVAFGIAPSILMFSWVIEPNLTGMLMPIGWGSCFVFISCAALRLARFNVDTSNQASAFFVGMPTPAGALSVLGFYGFVENYYHTNSFIAILAVIYLLALGIAMVSSIPFASVKKVNFNKNKLLIGLLISLILGIFVVYPWLFLFFGMVGYFVSGLLVLFYRRNRHTRKPEEKKAKEEKKEKTEEAK